VSAFVLNYELNGGFLSV